jgi:magnesium-transporting ATPase (P-type)
MSIDLMFNLLFLSQIILMSIWLPAIVARRVRSIMAAHPETQYPRLYPRGSEFHERKLQRFIWGARATAMIGLFFWLVYNFDASNEDYAGVVWLVFMLQCLPYVMLEVFAFKAWRLMRVHDKRRVRSASLQPRRITDIIDTTQLIILGLSFATLCGFIAYVDQFNYSWFGGWLNAIILAATYVFLGGLVAWQFFGRTKDPYLSESDRTRQFQHMVSQFVFVCVALSIYAMVMITLRMLDMDSLRQLAMSVYCQSLALVYYLTMLRSLRVNFEVYRETSPV